MDRDELLKKLTILDFMAVDLHLYLDTHPYDMEALAEYHRVVEEASEVRYKYEKHCGPLCSYRSDSSKNCWNWIDDPWPWCNEFNYQVCGRGRY